MGFRVRKVSEDYRDWWTWDVGRFWYSLTHLLSKKSGAMARDDFSHAYVNVFVEFIRASAYLGGHIMAILLPWLLLAVVWK